MDSLSLQDKYQKLSACFRTIQANVTVCAVKAIDSVMSENDPDWFAAFKAQELTFKDNIALVREDQSKLSDIDFQALIKIFRFRESKEDLKFVPNQKDLITIDAVFERYNLERKVNGKSKFSAMLDELIIARNEVAHLSAELAEAGYLEAGNDEILKDTIYALRKAIIEFLSFLSYFKVITSSSGVSYYDSASDELERTEKELGLVTYSVSEIIKEYSLSVSAEAFADYCRKVHIPTHNRRGEYYFESADVEMTVRIVKTGVASTRKKNIVLLAVLLSALFITLCVLFSALMIPFLSKLFTGGASSGGSSSDYSSSDYSSSEHSSGQSSGNSSQQSSNPSSSQSPTSQEAYTDHFKNINIDGRYTPNEVTVVPKEVYWNGNTLRATCYIVNALDHQIINTHINYIKITDGKGTIIAEGNFNTSQNLVIDSMAYVEHTFNFSGDAIITRNANLNYLELFAYTRYQNN